MDVLVNNAGKGHSWFFEAVEDTSEFQKIADIDFWGNVSQSHRNVVHVSIARQGVSVWTNGIPLTGTTIEEALFHAGSLFEAAEGRSHLESRVKRRDAPWSETMLVPWRKVFEGRTMYRFA